MEEKIILFMKENRFLYDKRKKHYKNMYLRDVKFRELANALNVPVKRVKERWRTLKDKYLREIKFAKRGSSSDSQKQQKKWKWMEHLRFLSDCQITKNEIKSENFRVTRGKQPNDKRGEHHPTYIPTTDDPPIITTFPAAPFPIALFSIAPSPVEPYSTTEELSLGAPPSQATHKSTELGDVSLSDIAPHSAKAPPCGTALPSIVQSPSGTTINAKDTVEQQLTEVLQFVRAISHEKKPASRLFFENLAQQLEEARLPPPKIAILQAELLAAFNRIVYHV